MPPTNPAELRELSERATAGPWELVASKFPTDGAFDFGIAQTGARGVLAECFGRLAENVYPPAEANAAFIVALVNAYRSGSLLEREPVPEVGATPGVVDYVLRFGSRCRDCADEDGVCPASGLPCEGARKAVEHVVGALNYGVEHGYITLADAGFKDAASPPPPSVDRERVEKIAERCDAEARRLISAERAGEWEDERPGVLAAVRRAIASAKADAAAIRSLLAAGLREPTAAEAMEVARAYEDEATGIAGGRAAWRSVVKALYRENPA